MIIQGDSSSILWLGSNFSESLSFWGFFKVYAEIEINTDTICIFFKFNHIIFDELNFSILKVRI